MSTYLEMLSVCDCITLAKRMIIPVNLCHDSTYSSKFVVVGSVKRQCAQQIAKVFDQHLAFIALEPSIFSLGMPNVYLELNDPAAQDTQIEVRTS